MPEGIVRYICFRSKQTSSIMSKTTTPRTYPAEVLSFVRGDNLATIATNGLRHVSQEFECVKEHSSLKTAIAYLESKGYKIDTSNFQSI